MRALRHEPDRIDQVETIVNALSRESARGRTASSRRSCCQEREDGDGVVHAAYEASQKNLDQHLEPDRRLEGIDKQLVHLAQMIATIDRELATTSTAFRRTASTAISAMPATKRRSKS